MLLNFTELCRKYNLKLKSIIHVGGHWGQEYVEYKENNCDFVLFIEPCKEAYERLLIKFEDNMAVACSPYACSDYIGKGIMYKDKTNNGMSNSLLRPDRHLLVHPDVVFEGEEEVDVTTLDKLMTDHGWIMKKFNTLVMDTQGAEGRVLKGAKETLKHIDYVYSEINFGSTYVNNTLADELDSLLSDFERVETSAKVGGLWGDCLYIRKSLLS